MSADSNVRNLLASEFIIGIVTGFLLIALPLYLTELKIDISSIGYVFGIATIFYAFLSFLLGASSEHKGRLGVGVAATIGMAASSLFFGILPLLSITVALVIFTVSKIIFDSSESVQWNIVKIRVLDLFHHKRFGHGFGTLIVYGSSGTGLGMLLGGALLYLVPLQTIFFAMSALLFLSLFFYRKTGDIRARPRKERTSHIQNFMKTSRLFKTVILFNTLIYSSGVFVGNFGLPLFQKEVLGMTTQQVLLITGLAWLVYGAFSLWGGKLYDRHGNKILVAALALIVVNSFVFFIVKDILLFSVVLIADYIISGFIDSPRFALAGIVSRENKGVLMSISQLMPVIVLGIVMLLFGESVKLFSFESMFVFRAVMFAAAIPIILYANTMIGTQRRGRKAN